MKFQTLNASLESANLLDFWPNESIAYNSTVRCVVNKVFVSITRFEDGTYEEPVSYASQCDDFIRVIKH